MTTWSRDAKKSEERRFSAAECFGAALKKLLQERGYGAQVLLSKEIGRGTKHISDVVRGRRLASLDFQERAAAYFELAPEEMIAMGRRLLNEEGDAFPYSEEAAQYRAREERGNFIYRKTIEEVGLDRNPFFSNRTLNELIRADWDAYVAGNLGDGQLYNRTKEEIRQIAEIVSEHFAPRRKRQGPKKS